MKYLFIHSTMNPGGAERVIANLSNYLSRQGNLVTVAVMQDGVSYYKLDKKIRFINMIKANNSSSILEAIKNHGYTIEKIRKILKTEKPDIIICFAITLTLDTFIANLRYKSKLVYSERANPYISKQGTIWKKVRRPLSLLLDGVIFQTAGAQNYYPKKVQRRSIIIQNPIYSEDFSCLPAETRREEKIVSVGRLIESKGYDILIAAFGKINKIFPNQCLYIYGEGKERLKLQNLINELRLNEKVILCGNVKDIKSYIYNAKLFVFSSRHEGMPNALMEAMACGLPCVSTDCDMGPNELIRDGINGLLVPVDDIEKMAEAIITILQDDNYAATLGRNAANIQKSNHISIIGKQFQDYMEEIL